MANKIGIALFVIMLATSCQSDSKENASERISRTGADASRFIGDWVQPNPINESEVQGFALKKDGTAESINMATLQYKNWWYESDKLNLVAESIGNGISFMDTAKYEVVKITDTTLELKDERNIYSYKKQ